MCDKCNSEGNWNMLEKFWLLNKSIKPNDIQELKTLKNSMKIQKNFISKWNKIRESNQSLASLSPDLYEKITHIFSLPVRSSKLNVYYIYCKL